MKTELCLLIVGASGHGRVVADVAECLGYSDIAFLDDAKAGERFAGHPVVGCVSDAAVFPDAEFVVAIGDAEVRERIQREITCVGLRAATLVHPRAYVSSHARVGAGSVVMAGAVVNPGATLGEGCIVNTGATVDHDCVIGDFSHVSVGAHLAGTVRAGERTWVGAGAVVSNNVSICSDCTIGAGAVVVRDIEVPGTYVGVPARLISRKELGGG